jgi:AraC-like DNA-binding protein
LDTSVRSLARRLSECGKTYQSLIDETRFNAATELLRGTAAPIGEIGLSIGFNDQANFSRLFHRIAGISPRDYRRVQLGRVEQAEYRLH